MRSRLQHLSSVLLLWLAVPVASVAQLSSFPTEGTLGGRLGSPGMVDRSFLGPLGGIHRVVFEGGHDIRTAMVQADGKILVGGTFRLRASNITYTLGGEETFVANVTWRNLARLNPDGTLDTSFISPTAISSAAAVQNPNITYGPDGAVYSILVVLKDDLFQYLVAGDFLNFSHNNLGNPAPRLRYFMLDVLAANPNIGPAPGEPRTIVPDESTRINLRNPLNPNFPAPIGTLVLQADNGLTYRKIQDSSGSVGSQDWQIVPKPAEALVTLSDNVSDGDGFNGPVRKIRRLFGTLQGPNVPAVPDRETRLTRPYPIGTRVYQLDNGFLYEKISGPLADSQDRDWEVIPAGRRPLYFAAGDFTSFVNDPDERFITRFDFNPGGITIIRTEWETPPIPDRRVWDVTALGPRIFFVGEFDTVNAGALQWRKIGAIDETGATLPDFNPGSGFNDTAMSIVADPIQNNVIVAGYFTDYDGNALGRLARINTDGSLVAGFPADNNGNSEGANGPIRAVTRQPDGRLLIAGEFTTYNGIRRGGVARLEADGSLDLTFLPPGEASGIQNFGFDIDGGPATASSFGRGLAVGNFIRLFRTNATGVARFIGGSYPVIWFQPSQITPPHTVQLGGDLTLHVVATDNFVGYPGIEEPPFTPPQVTSEPLLYQWQRNNRDLPGEVLPYLLLENVEPSDVGNYRVKIRNSQFEIISEAVRVSTLNPFAEVFPRNGIAIQGIIEGNSLLNGGLGGELNLRVNRLGGYTGTVTLGAAGGRPVRYRIRGQYNYLEGLELEIPRPNQPPMVLRLQADLGASEPGVFNFDFTGPDNYLSDGTQLAAITAWNNPWSRTNPAADYEGSYNVVLEGDPALMGEIVGLPPLERPVMSQGYGLVGMRVNGRSGRARVVGTLSDGSRFSATSTLWGDDNGTLPIWASLYRNEGSLNGTLSILGGVPGNPVEGFLVWNKPGGVRNSPDADGFQNAELLVAPGSGIYESEFAQVDFVSIEFSDGAWAGLQGGLLDEFLTPVGSFVQDFDVTRGRAVPLEPNDYGVGLSLNLRSGAFAGRFANPDFEGRPRRVRFRGMVITADGFPQFFGYFVMPNAARRPDFQVGGSIIGF
jgi:uncharacterized delta-60 repeat protein